MPSNMDPPSAFKASAASESRALQALSPERVNSKQRPSSVMSMAGLRTPKASEFEAHFLEGISTSSNPSSPSRKANLFADYKTKGSPTAAGFGGLPLGNPLSPPLTDLASPFRSSHVRTNSDVQGLVKRFEHLDVRDRDAESTEWRKKQEAELRRAQIAREEAESDVRRLREENRRLKRDIDEGRDREHRITKRLEVVSSEAANAREAHAAQASVYEKEVRKSRKEAFKSASVVVKLQEEVRATRSSLRVTQSGLDLEKQKVQRREQEAFSAEYKLVAAQEESEKLQISLKTVTEEREALKTSLKEEEVARIAAEGMIALPTNQDDDDEFKSPRKSPQKRNISPLSDDKENIHTSPRKMIDNRHLEEELAREQMRREHAEEMIEFLTMECSFRCCSNRGAQKPMSADIARVLDSLRKDMVEIFPPVTNVHEVEGVMEVDPPVERLQTSDHDDDQMDIRPETPTVEEETHEAEEQDRSMTLEADTPEGVAPAELPQGQEELRERPATPPKSPELEIQQDEAEAEVEVEVEETKDEEEPIEPSSPEHVSPQTPPHITQRAIRTVTTTTTVPIQFTPAPKPQQIFAIVDAERTPAPSFDGSKVGTTVIDREAALAAIQYRRGRAKSIAEGHMTPRKQMLEGMKERRDISAPILGGKTTAFTPAHKGSASVGRAGRKIT